MTDLIKTIEGIEGKEGKKYWINTLKVNDSIKGRLYVYFGLIGA